MGIYEKHILPRLIHLSMQSKTVMAERARFLPMASGRVLEVGIGSGLNIPFYTRRIETLCGVDPSRELLRMARERAEAAPFPVELIGCSGERIPLKDEMFDSVVTTWTLCTIPNAVVALREMHRVLRPGGQLLFIEHGRSPDARVLVWQNRFTPLWRRFGGGCNLNRKIDDLILEAGFHIIRLESGYVQGPKPFTFLYRGVARPA
jgi:ubiquinone/menaquinone biosynthesis C-methylase UbiE